MPVGWPALKAFLKFVRPHWAGIDLASESQAGVVAETGEKPFKPIGSTREDGKPAIAVALSYQPEADRATGW